MIELAKKHPKILIFCFFTFTLTVIGQSYFLAFLNDSLAHSSGLNTRQLSFTYSLGTLLAALCLPVIGKLIDNQSVKFMATLAGLGVGLGMLLLALAKGPWGLLVAYFVTRLMGQTTLGLSASTFVSKYFGKNRGKALSLISLGKFVGDALLPVGVVALLGVYGHQKGLIGVGLFMALIYVPMAFFLLKKVGSSPLYEESQVVQELAQGGTAISFYKDVRFYFIIALGMLIPFAMTGLFFQQKEILQFKNWSTELFAQSFVVYSLGQVLTNLWAGWMIDRFSAKKLMPYSLFGYTLALYTLYGVSGKWGLYLYMSLTGMAVSFCMITKAAFLAEAYGTPQLGAMRSVDSSVMVCATALSPYLFALWLENDEAISVILKGLVWLGAFCGVAVYFIGKTYLSRGQEAV